MYDIGIKNIGIINSELVAKTQLIIRSASIRTFYDHSVTVKYK